MHDFRKLNVWSAAIELVTEVYKITEAYPKSEMYGICNQMRRCAVSIPSNIAEGCGRKSDKEFDLFLGYGYGSCCELETQLIISKNLGYIQKEKEQIMINKIELIQKMIYKLKQSIPKN